MIRNVHTIKSFQLSFLPSPEKSIKIHQYALQYCPVNEWINHLSNKQMYESKQKFKKEILDPDLLLSFISSYVSENVIKSIDMFQ